MEKFSFVASGFWRHQGIETISEFLQTGLQKLCLRLRDGRPNQPFDWGIFIARDFRLIVVTEATRDEAEPRCFHGLGGAEGAGYPSSIS